MEILLLVTLITVAASCLYVAATFNKRTEQNTIPMLKRAVKDISERFEAVGKDLSRQLRAITNEVRQDREPISPDYSEIQGRLDLTDRQISSIPSQILPEFKRIERLGELINARKDELSRDLLQLEQRVAQLSEALAQQGIRISAIYSYAKNKETQARQPLTMDSLVMALLEAESDMDRKGWGNPPHLYALTEKISPAAADHGPSAEMRDARQGGLVPVEQGPLSDGDSVEGLANIHWPDDVVGCVLVTELIDLPPSGEKDAPIDPVAAEEWTSTRPDGRPARLAVAVCRKGEFTCGLRIKGEDDVQVRPDLAGDLVTALLGTFEHRI